MNFALGYDAANELTSATGSQNAAVVKTFAYTYDPGQNRVAEQVEALLLGRALRFLRGRSMFCGGNRLSSWGLCSESMKVVQDYGDEDPAPA